jgi:hypothetical protein
LAWHLLRGVFANKKTKIQKGKFQISLYKSHKAHKNTANTSVSTTPTKKKGTYKIGHLSEEQSKQKMKC